MGGDLPPTELFELIPSFAQENPQHTISVYVTVDHLESLQSSQPPPPNLLIKEAQSYIRSDETPRATLRRRDTTMDLGIQEVHRKEIGAFISVGNTGALLAKSVTQLNKLPQVERPGLLACLPSKKGSMAVCDVGANVEFRPQHLLQFALMASQFMQRVYKLPKPRVGLLNIGKEEEKGSEKRRETYKLLQKNCPNFIGNVEGSHGFSGEVDVLVTDGFTGNIFLKTAEGAANYALDLINEKEGVDFAKIRKKIHFEEYPGAILCGLDGTIIKCHGRSGPKALLTALQSASLLITDPQQVS